MGYESKIYIVQKNDLRDEDGMKYAQIIAMFNMCKIGNMSSVFEEETDCYIYADDGNTKILEDKYGDPLTEATVEDVIYVLEEAIDSGENYRRIFPLLSTLRTIYEQQKDGIWKNIVLLHYGY